MCEQVEEREHAAPARPANELPRWAIRVRRVLDFIDTAGMSEWVRPIAKKSS